MYMPVSSLLVKKTTPYYTYYMRLLAKHGKKCKPMWPFRKNYFAVCISYGKNRSTLAHDKPQYHWLIIA